MCEKKACDSLDKSVCVCVCVCVIEHAYACVFVYVDMLVTWGDI
jgi:hypothetical protein